MKQLCVVRVYNNVEHIKISFDSFYNENVDFFIVENCSKNSDEIEKYFLTKKLVGYIRFDKNIAANAFNIFLKDYYEFINDYDIITFTDGDLYVYNYNSLFEELINNLNNDNVIISSANLYRLNYYNLLNKEIGVDKYIEFMKNREVENGYIISNTANNFITLKRENIYLLKDINFIDSNIRNKIKEINKLWVSTKNNILYHLTWDLYVDGNEYYEFKKNNKLIWRITEYSNYKKII
jgi:hypothetical protein